MLALGEAREALWRRRRRRQERRRHRQPSLSGLGAEYVKGIHRMGAKILIVIELPKVINIAKEMISKYS